MQPNNEDAPPGVLDRGLAILEFFAVMGETSPSVVAKSLGLSRSAAYRIVDTLRQRGFLETNEITGKLRLGVRAAELGMAAIAGVDVARIAPPYMKDLARSTLETSFLAVMNDNSMVYIYKEEGPQAVKMSTELGGRRPLHCTSLGKAFMSVLPHEERQALIGTLDLQPFTENTITDVDALEDDLILTKERGYSTDRIENEEGVACFGAPILDYRRLPIAAISIAGPAERIFPQEQEVTPLLIDAASEISRRLGFIEI